MNFEPSARTLEWTTRLQHFMDQHVYPSVAEQARQEKQYHWKTLPIAEELKARAKAAGLWNLFMPPSPPGECLDESFRFESPGLSNLEYAPLAEIMGRVRFASEVFNCSAPDTGNMEVFHRYGTAEQKDKWLKPLMEGEIRSAFLMTEPAVASSDATNIQTEIRREGDHYVINGRKWWASGIHDPRCKILIVMGKTDPKAEGHRQQSQILVPRDTPGIKLNRWLPVF